MGTGVFTRGAIEVPGAAFTASTPTRGKVKNDTSKRVTRVCSFFILIINFNIY
jgi:hypothetical protein